MLMIWISYIIWSRFGTKIIISAVAFYREFIIWDCMVYLVIKFNIMQVLLLVNIMNILISLHRYFWRR